VRLLVVAAGLLLGLAGAELAVRAAGAAPEVSPVRRGRYQLSANPRLVFEPVPGMSVEGGDGGGVPLYYEYPGTANRLGYRDRDHPLDKPPGTYRIVVLGDSVAAGWGVERIEDVFPALLEDALDRPGRAVEVLNFAVTGYNTAQEVETLAARALAYEPDLVLLAYCLNDRRPPDPRLVAALREVAEEAAAAGRRSVAPAALERGLQRLALRSALYRLLRFRVLDPEATESEELLEAWSGVETAGMIGEEKPPAAAWEGGGDDDGTDGETDGAADVVFGPDGEPISGPAGVRAAFERLAGLAGRHRFEVLVAIFPHQRSPRHFAEHHAQVRRFATDHGFGVADLAAAFATCRRTTDEPLAFDRFHPTAAGHRCAAAALVEHLRREGPAALRPAGGRAAAQ
jgi:lysophospholipase L1-like esterase